MIGWLLIAAFFASLLAVALNAARPDKPPQRPARPRPVRSTPIVREAPQSVPAGPPLTDLRAARLRGVA